LLFQVLPFRTGITLDEGACRQTIKGWVTYKIYGALVVCHCSKYCQGRIRIAKCQALGRLRLALVLANQDFERAGYLELDGVLGVNMFDFALLVEKSA